MDGIETIAALRGNDTTTEGTMDRVLSTLLVELDGVDDDDSSDESEGIAVIGITHNVSWIDPALLRPGRLAKVVELHGPDSETRARIVQRELDGTAASFVVACPGTDSSVLSRVTAKKRNERKSSVADMIARATNGMAASSVVAICHDLKLWLARNSAGNDGTLVNQDDARRIQRELIDQLVQSRK